MALAEVLAQLDVRLTPLTPLDGSATSLAPLASLTPLVSISFGSGADITQTLQPLAPLARLPPSPGRGQAGSALLAPLGSAPNAFGDGSAYVHAAASSFSFFGLFKAGWYWS